MARLRVLVVDDDKSVCKYLDELLTPEGCDLVATQDPLEGLELLKKKEQFHILILDLQMPGMTGLELLEEIRKVDTDVAVLILTAHGTLKSATDAINFDVSGYMNKPFKGDALRDLVNKVARKKGIIVRPEDELHIEIGRKIRILRREKRLTLRQMGRRTGLSVSLLSQIERAESSASVSSLYKIATALDARIVDVFEGC